MVLGRFVPWQSMVNHSFIFSLVFFFWWVFILGILQSFLVIDGYLLNSFSFHSLSFHPLFLSFIFCEIILLQVFLRKWSAQGIVSIIIIFGIFLWDGCRIGFLCHSIFDVNYGSSRSIISFLQQEFLRKQIVNRIYKIIDHRQPHFKNPGTVCKKIITWRLSYHWS